MNIFFHILLKIRGKCGTLGVKSMKEAEKYGGYRPPGGYGTPSGSQN
jgi:hypothetical protein